MPYTLTVNGKRTTVDAPADMPLLWVLRDMLDLKGTKYGCGMALCGACTVHLKGEPVRSCQVTVASAAGQEVTTIEGLSRDGVPPAAAGLDRGGRAAVRLLPGGTDHERRGPAQEEAAALRRRHRRSHAGQPVPLRHLPAHPRSHPPGRRARLQAGSPGHPGADRRAPWQRPLVWSAASSCKVTALAGGGILLSADLGMAEASRDAWAFMPNPFIRIGADGVGHADREEPRVRPGHQEHAADADRRRARRRLEAGQVRAGRRGRGALRRAGRRRQHGDAAELGTDAPGRRGGTRAHAARGRRDLGRGCRPVQHRFRRRDSHRERAPPDLRPAGGASRDGPRARPQDRQAQGRKGLSRDWPVDARARRPEDRHRPAALRHRRQGPGHALRRVREVPGLRRQGGERQPRRGAQAPRRQARDRRRGHHEPRRAHARRRDPGRQLVGGEQRPREAPGGLGRGSDGQPEHRGVRAQGSRARHEARGQGPAQRRRRGRSIPRRADGRGRLRLPVHLARDARAAELHGALQGRQGRVLGPDAVPAAGPQDRG